MSFITYDIQIWYTVKLEIFADLNFRVFAQETFSRLFNLAFFFFFFLVLFFFFFIFAAAKFRVFLQTAKIAKIKRSRKFPALQYI